MENNYNIDDHIGNSLRDYSVKPSARSFDEMMRKLAEKKKRRRLIIFLFAGSGSVAAFLILFFSGVLPLQKESAPPLTENNNQSWNEQPVAPIVKKTDSEKIPASSIEKKSESGTAEKSTLQPVRSREKISQQSGSEKTPRNLVTVPSARHNGPDLQQQNAPEENSPASGQLTNAAIAKNPVYPDTSETTTAVVSATSPDIELMPHYLETTSPQFIKDTTSQELVVVPVNTLALEYSPLLIDTRKKYKFMLGANFDPQFSRFMLTENKNREARYDSTLGSGFSDVYLQSRKRFNRPFFSYAYGLKAGVSIRDKWELWFGIGFQRYSYVEFTYGNYGNTVQPAGPSYQSAGFAISRVSVTYTYFYYQGEVRKNIQLNPFLKVNMGMGLRLTHLYSERISVTNSGSYSSDGSVWNSLAQWGCLIDAKAGIVHDFGRRWQWRLSPGLFCSPGSVFRKDFLIKQRPYGLQLEAMLVLKLN